MNKLWIILLKLLKLFKLLKLLKLFKLLKLLVWYGGGMLDSSVAGNSIFSTNRNVFSYL